MAASAACVNLACHDPGRDAEKRPGPYSCEGSGLLLCVLLVYCCLLLGGFHSRCPPRGLCGLLEFHELVQLAPLVGGVFEVFP